MATSLGTVLIIDDDPDVQEVLKDRLESLGYRAVPALTGRQGLELLDEESPEMVFLDIELPDMNGLETLKAIRKRQNAVAVVIITGYGTIERAVQAMRDGAYDFVAKPLKPGYVALVVGRAMERERLKREVEILSDEAGERYHLVVTKSSKMNLAVAKDDPDEYQKICSLESKRMSEQHGACASRISFEITLRFERFRATC